jgi:hypothetical protein
MADPIVLENRDVELGKSRLGTYPNAAGTYLNSRPGTYPNEWWCCISISI